MQPKPISDISTKSYYDTSGGEEDRSMSCIVFPTALSHCSSHVMDDKSGIDTGFVQKPTLA